MAVKRYMSDEEIVRNYREAKDQKEQIQILADMNLCGKEEIIRILEEVGESVAVRRRRKQGKEDPAAAVEKADGIEAVIKEKTAVGVQYKKRTKAERKGIPATVMEAVYGRMEKLDQEIREREKEYKQLAAFIEENAEKEEG